MQRAACQLLGVGNTHQVWATWQQGKANYNNLVNFYKQQNRSIKEQNLNLSAEEKQSVYTFLETNYAKNQGAYLYDFF